MSDTAPARHIVRDTPEFRRLNLALFAGGFSTFAVLYCVQPLLPVFADAFDVDAATASLALSMTTGVLAGCVLFNGFIADRVNRRLMMTASLVAAALLTLVVALAPSWPLLLLGRTLTGVALSGIPAVALTYIGEEVDGPSIGLAVGLYIGGNVFGGMVGRLAMGVLADHIGWRGAVAGLGLCALVSSGLMWLTLPVSRHFVPRFRSLPASLAGLVIPFRDKGLPWLFLEAALCMGAFVTIYNYIGFRLLAAPYNLSQTAVGLIFVCYLLGVVSSAWVGDLAGRLGRRKVFWAVITLMLAGVLLTATRPLPLVILGIALITFGYFGVHSVSSSWVGRRGGAHRAEASSMFLFCYYSGASVIGTLGGYSWTHWGWPGVVTLVGSLLTLALAIAIRLAFLQPLPGNEPGAKKIGK